eukprot:14176980-Alexandrium_andersonii.AAC.1
MRARRATPRRSTGRTTSSARTTSPMEPGARCAAVRSRPAWSRGRARGPWRAEGAGQAAPSRPSRR